jgi:hypothetical protein
MAQHALEQFGVTDEKIQKLMEIAADPQKRDEFITQAAQMGPPPGVDGGLAPPSGATPNFIPPTGNAPAQQAVSPEAAGQAPAAAPQPPQTPEEEIVVKGLWEQVLDNITNPENPNSSLFQTGLNLLQPIQPNQSLGGHVAQSVNAGVQDFIGKKEARDASTRQGKLDTSKLANEEAQRKLAEAQTGKLGAETDFTGRKIRSLDFQDDLTKAQAELARARAKGAAKGAKSAGGAKLALENAKVVAWFNANPGKFVDKDDARADLIKFETTKGKSAFNDAMVSLLQDLPVWKADKIQPIIDLVKKESSAASERPVSPRQQTKVDLERLKVLTPADWAAVSADPLKRVQLEKAFGKDVIDGFIGGGQ